MKILLIALVLVAGIMSPGDAGTYSLSPEDQAYVRWLEDQLNSKPAGNPQKFLLVYLQYLKTGHGKFASQYGKALEDWVKKKKEGVPDVGIFEGDSELCQGEECSKSIGTLTESYLVPRIKTGQADALEIYYAQRCYAMADGAEGESFFELETTRINPYKQFPTQWSALTKKYSTPCVRKAGPEASGAPKGSS